MREGVGTGRESRWLELWIPAVVVLADQASKYLVRQALPVHDSRAILPGFLDFTHVRNTGAAFGMLNGIDFPYKTLVIGVIATAALVGVAFYSRTLGQGQWLARLGLALIVGGAAGNLIDRITIGEVVDFVDVYWRTHHFWVFNVADAAITVGVAAMILDMLRTGTHVSHTV